MWSIELAERGEGGALLCVLTSLFSVIDNTSHGKAIACWKGRNMVLRWDWRHLSIVRLYLMKSLIIRVKRRWWVGGGRGKNDDRMAKKNVCVNALPWKKFFWNYYVWWCGWSWRPGWPGECGEYRDYLDYVSHVVIHLIKENRRPAENGLCDGNKELESLKCREETSAFSCDWWSTALMKTFAVSEFLPNSSTNVDPSICTQFQLQSIPHLSPDPFPQTCIII